MKKFIQKCTIILFCLLQFLLLAGQENSDFEIELIIEATSVKNQYKSGTCWSFGTISFIESELLRMKKGEFDLSEMFIARHTYKQKAINHIRMLGHTFLTPGGQPHDVMNVIKIYGIVPESDYTGRTIGESLHNHNELDTLAKAMIKGLVSNKGKLLSPRWKAAFDAMLDVYLGKLPEKVEYKGKQYTPIQLRDKVLELNPDDYIEITSFTHHPFYEEFCLESRFNWSFGLYQNVPLNEFIQIIDNALENGFSLVWNGDVSEHEFSFYDGTGYVTGFEHLADQEKRQEQFDNHNTTVDHIMHIIGTAKDEEDNKYYVVKNSWGTSNPCKGYMYLSESYIKLKTVAIMLHEDGLPKNIAGKLQITQ